MSERRREPSDGVIKAAGFVVMAVIAAGVVAGLTRGRSSSTDKSPLAPGATPPRHVRGVQRDRPEAVEPSARFEVHRQERGEGGSLVILGITHNHSEVAINPPELQVTFKSADGAVVHREKSRWPFDMHAGAEVPTRLVYSSVPPYESLDVDVEVSAAVGLPAAQGLVADEVESVPGQASWTVRGQAANRGQASARWLKVVAAAYGPQDQLQWIGTRSLDGAGLAPGESRPFELRAFRADIEAEHPRFEVQVFGRER